MHSFHTFGQLSPDFSLSGQVMKRLVESLSVSSLTTQTSNYPHQPIVPNNLHCMSLHLTIYIQHPNLVALDAEEMVLYDLKSRVQIHNALFTHIDSELQTFSEA